MTCSPGPGLVGFCCDGTCSALWQDPDNCGACGNVCSSGICPTSITGAPGQCFIDDAGADTSLPSCSVIDGQACAVDAGALGICCSSSEFSANATCTAIATDPDNCGACGLECPSGQTCENGVCSGNVAPCGVGTQNLYCPLAGGVQGVCEPGGGCIPLCDDGQIYVDDLCVATTCAAQPTGVYCLADGGTPGDDFCCGTGSVCVDVTTDPTNCGTCGKTCVTGETCRAGLCGFDTCAMNGGYACFLDGGAVVSGGECCDGACVDTRTDPSNCGMCGMTCSTECLNGTCG